jgi:hypothetical protein
MFSDVHAYRGRGARALERRLRAVVLTLLRHRCEPRRRFDRAFGAEAYGTAKGIERRNQLAGSEWLMRLG